MRTSSASEVAGRCSAVLDQPDSRRAAINLSSLADSRADCCWLIGLTRFARGSASSSLERVMLERSTDELIDRLAAQWFVIESILSKVRLCEMSKLAFFPFEVSCAEAPAAEPRAADELLRGIPLDSAAARASVARRVISSITASIAAVSIPSVSSFVAELVDKENVPGIVKEKELAAPASLTGEPKTNGRALARGVSALPGGRATVPSAGRHASFATVGAARPGSFEPKWTP